MKIRKLHVIVSVGLLALVTWACIGIQQSRNRRQIEHATRQSEANRVLDNINRSLAGADGIVDDAEKVKFLRFLGIHDGIQSGQVISIDTLLEYDNGLPSYPAELSFVVSLGKEVQQTKMGQFIVPAKRLGVFPKAKLEQYASENIQWIEQ